MRALVDTDVLIDHLRGVEEARTFLQNCFEAYETTYISVITVSEIRAGMREEEAEKTRSLLDLFQSVPVTKDMAVRGGVYRNRFEDTHGVLLPDALIAATAFELNADLYSYNTGHYPMEEITVHAPSELQI